MTSYTARRALVLGLMLLLATGTSMAYYSFGPQSAFLIRGLGLSKGQLGMLFSVAAIGNLGASLGAGIASDRFNFRLIIICSTVLIALGCIGLAGSTSFVQALIWALVIGIGFSCITPLTNRSIYDWFSTGKQAFAIGFKQAGIPLGTGIGAFVFPVIAEMSSWRLSYVAGAMIVMAAGVVGFVCYRRPPQMPIAQAYKGLTTKSDKKEDYRKRVLNRRVAATLVCLGPLGVSFSFWQISMVTFIVAYLNEQLNMSPIIAGKFLALTQLSGALSRPAFGWLSDILWHGKRKPILIITSGMNIALLCGLASGIRTPPIWVLLSLAIVMGSCGMGWFGPYFALIVESISKEHAGFASSIASAISTAGMIIGAPLFGYVVDLSGSYRMAFLVDALCLGVATLIAVFSSLMYQGIMGEENRSSARQGFRP